MISIPPRPAEIVAAALAELPMPVKVANIRDKDAGFGRQSCRIADAAGGTAAELGDDADK